MNRLAPTLLIAALAALAAFSPTTHAETISDKARNDTVTFMASENPAMRRAMEKARGTLNDFFAKAKKPAPGTSHYGLKVGVPYGNAGGREYMWVNDFKADPGKPDSFTGTLANTPQLVTGMKNGQVFKFSRDMIYDWTYTDEKGRMQGNFTLCALLTQEPRAEAEAVKKQYGLKCEGV